MQNQGIFAWFKSRTFRSSARKLNHERKGRHSRRTRPLTQLRKKEASPCSFSLPASAKFDTPGRQAPAQKRKKKTPQKKNNRIKRVRQEARNIARKEGAIAARGTNKRPRRNGVDAELAQGLRRHQGHDHRQPRQPQLRLQGAPRSSVSPPSISPDFSFTKVWAVHPNPSFKRACGVLGCGSSLGSVWF